MKALYSGCVSNFSYLIAIYYTFPSYNGFEFPIARTQTILFSTWENRVVIGSGKCYT